MIYVDVHEKKLIEKVKDKDDWLVDSLGVDIVVDGEERRYVIERKTIGDMIGSVYSGRLWKQLEALKEIEGIPVLILEGNDFQFNALKKKRKLSMNVWYGMLIGVMNMGVYIIPTKSLNDTIIAVERMYEKAKKKTDRVVIKRRMKLWDDNIPIRMLMVVNGIGEKKADKLLSHFKTIRAIANAKEEEITDVVGKVGKRIYEAMNDVYDKQ